MENGTWQQAPIVLASASPRRRYLLRQAGLQVQVRPAHIDESRLGSEDSCAHVRRLALEKARAVAAAAPEAWTIGADTVVTIDDQVLGKPADAGQAAAMLRRLSGQTHRVLTGLAVLCPARRIEEETVVATQVTFKHLSEAEIDWYVRTGEPFDKAGAYAIQGIGTFLVRRINGSYTNVVGLPVCETIEILIANGAIYPAEAEGISSEP